MSDKKFTLYYFPGSYYSQKAVLALFEKECDFNKKFIFLHFGGNTDPAYMRMNPEGKVPVLQDGQKIIIESEVIVDYIDKEVNSGTRLVPDPSTSFGKEVQRLRKFLNEIAVEIATFGVLTNPELSVSGMKMPGPLKFLRKKLSGDAFRKNEIEKLEKLADKHPDLREAYLKKADFFTKFYESTRDKEKVVKTLDDIDKRCDHLEECLKKTKGAVSPGEEYWIAGQQFTAADITVVIFMDRMTGLGLDERYFSKDKRPLLNEYKQKIDQRKTVQMLREEIKNIYKYVLWEKVKESTPYLLSAATLGVAIGVGIYFLKNK